jgi:hypothetical protein
MTLKVFSVGASSSFIGSAVRDALGLPSHVRQGNYIVVAASKRAGAELAESLGVRISVRDPDYGSALGWPLADAVLAHATEPGVYVTTSMSRPGDFVLRFVGKDVTETVGRVGLGQVIRFADE